MTCENKKERRRFARIPVSLQGEIIVPLRPPVPCLIRDITVEGALIELDIASWLPAKFQLHIPSAGFTTSCKVRRSKGQKLHGISFGTYLRSTDFDALKQTQNKPAKPATRTAGFGRRSR